MLTPAGRAARVRNRWAIPSNRRALLLPAFAANKKTR